MINPAEVANPKNRNHRATTTNGSRLLDADTGRDLTNAEILAAFDESMQDAAIGNLTSAEYHAHLTEWLACEIDEGRIETYNRARLERRH